MKGVGLLTWKFRALISNINCTNVTKKEKYIVGPLWQGLEKGKRKAILKVTQHLLMTS